MLPSNTVFIIGAGASEEVGLPVGSQLKLEIAKKLDLRFERLSNPIGRGDLALFEAIRREVGNRVNEYLDVCWQIRDGLPLASSIDDFIDAHRDNALVAQCGKLAIAAAILEAERKSKLYFERTRIDSSIDFDAIQSTWYIPFFRLLSQEVSRVELKTFFERITLVVFNYDRCIEHFLIHAIARHYHLPIESAVDLVKTLVVFRPYGTVGRFFDPSGELLGFGAKRMPSLSTSSSSLRTYTEQVQDDKTLPAMRLAISEADVLVFLGNAFHKNNLRLLELESTAKPRKRVYATRMYISDPDVAVVKTQLRRALKLAQARPGEEFFYFTGERERCADLFARYWISLKQEKEAG